MAVGPDMYRFSITLNRPMRDRLDTLAREYSMTRSSLIGMLIKNKWKEDGHTDDKDDGVSER